MTSPIRAKTSITVSAAANGFHLRGDVRENAGLRGDAIALDDAVEHVEQRFQGVEIIGNGVDADDGVAGAEEEAVDDGGGDACGVVSGVVGLEAGGEASRESNC